MIARRANRLNTLLVFVVGLCHIGSGAVQAAFGVTVPRRSSVAQRFSVLEYRRGNEDDSQWYSPPPRSIVEPSSPAAATTTTTTPAFARPPMGHKAAQTDITTMTELNAILNDETDDRLVVVKFYASWCRTCAMLGLKMDKLASEHADWVSSSGSTSNNRITTAMPDSGLRRGLVRFINVEYGAAREMCQDLQIQKLPTIHMYMPPKNRRQQPTMEKVQDFSCSLKEFYRIQDLTEGYIAQQQHRRQLMEENKATLPDVFDSFETTLDAGRDLIQAKLAAELPAAADRLYTQAAKTTSIDAPLVDIRSTKSSLWHRFRNRNSSRSSNE